MQAIDGKCAKCGATEFLLAEDHTIYTACEWDADACEWVSHGADREPTCTIDRIRFYCTACGEYHDVPNTLGGNE